MSPKQILVEDDTLGTPGRSFIKIKQDADDTHFFTPYSKPVMCPQISVHLCSPGTVPETPFIRFTLMKSKINSKLDKMEDKLL